MIRAIRPSAMAQDDAAIVSGWNVAPNVAYTLLLLPGSSSCGVLLYAGDGSTLIATGAALTGTAQPCVLLPQTGQTVEMVDGDLGWHLLITTIGTESQRTIRLGPAVDLPDEIHPVYGDDGLALARATAAIDAAAHYVDDIAVTCPLGLGAGLGDVVSVPVDGAAVVGQVESITWTATPDGTTEQAVIRRHVAIAPDVFVEPTPPTVADDVSETDQTTSISGNVLDNDDTGLTVTAVNGLAANVGQVVDGDNGGSFTVAANGSWTFDPDGDFAMLEGSETADTSVTYHASDGTAEAMATLTVTVSHANAAPVAVDDTGETTADATTSGNVLTNDTDADLDTLSVSQVAGSAGNVGVAVAGSNGGLFTISSNGAWSFDPDGDFDALTGEQTAATSVTYHVSDWAAEDEGTLTVTVSAGSVSASYADQILAMSPMRYFALDERSGSVIADKTLAQNGVYYNVGTGVLLEHATLTDHLCPKFLPASTGYGSLVFTDTMAAGFGISLWFKPDISLCQIGAHIITNSEYYASGYTKFPFKLFLDKAKSRIQSILSRGNDYTADDTISYSIQDFAVYNVIVNYVGSSYHAMYVNGSLVQQNLISWSISNSGLTWLIAQAHESGGGSNRSAFAGWLSDIVVRTTPFSTQEIAILART